MLARYPTTATNRNRARARWTLFHFLGIDIEKSSQRPTDDAALLDTNNPTLNNPACTVCHTVLDPVAGAFQNWSVTNLYRPDGNNTLDFYYRYPRAGERTLYREGDLWYRDMLEPGLFEHKIKARDNTLQALAALIVEEPGFLEASAAFWWETLFAEPLLNKPVVEEDLGYAEKYAAYEAQQAALADFSAVLAERLNARDLLVEMLVSPWFSAESAEADAFTKAHEEANLGSLSLLTPEQLGRKTQLLTGIDWRFQDWGSFGTSNGYDRHAVLMGGIDSEAVTTRSRALTPLMMSVLLTHATETACVAAAREFALPPVQRSLLPLIDVEHLPYALSTTEHEVPSDSYSKPAKLSFELDVSGAISIDFEPLNSYCKVVDGMCEEFRQLHFYGFNAVAPSGKQISIAADDARLRRRLSYCEKIERQGQYISASCALVVDLQLEEAGTYRFEASFSGYQSDQLVDFPIVQASVFSQMSVAELNNSAVDTVKRQIVQLIDRLHGKTGEPATDTARTAFEIYAAALDERRLEPVDNLRCNIFDEEGIFKQLLTADEFEALIVTDSTGRTRFDFEAARSQYPLELRRDPAGLKYAWSAVFSYLLSHFDYLHE